MTATTQEGLTMNKRSMSKAGSNNPAAKLTADKVAAIRRYAKRGPHPWGWRSKLASRYGVSPGTICDILAGRIWALPTKVGTAEKPAEND